MILGTISCFFDDSTTVAMIKCVNVGALLSNVTYAIGAKVLLDSSTPAEIPDFGIVEMILGTLTESLEFFFGLTVLQLSMLRIPPATMEIFALLIYFFTIFFSAAGDWKDESWVKRNWERTNRRRSLSFGGTDFHQHSQKHRNYCPWLLLHSLPEALSS